MIPVVDLQGPAPAQKTLARVLAVMSALLLVVGLVGLATVDPDDGGRLHGTPLAIVGSATDKTLAQTARMTMTTAFNLGGRAGPAVAADGAADFADNRFVMTVKAAALSMEMRSDGKTVWIKAPSSRAPDQWVAIDMAVLKPGESPFGALPGSNPASGTDPRGMLGLLKSNQAVKDAVEDGQAKVRGVETTKFKVTLDAAKLAGADPDLAQLGPVDLVLDLYVSNDGLVRRQAISLNPGAGQEGLPFDFSMTLTVDFYDFGVHVEVDPPPADQVTKADSLADLVQRFAGGR